jgi:hypothetical protein
MSAVAVSSTCLTAVATNPGSAAPLGSVGSGQAPAAMMAATSIGP